MRIGDKLRRVSELTRTIGLLVHEADEVDTLPSLHRTPDGCARVEYARDQFSIPIKSMFFLVDIFAAQSNVNVIGNIAAI